MSEENKHTTAESEAVALHSVCSAWRFITSLKFHAMHFNWLWRDEAIIVFGVASGRVDFWPEAKWLHSLRLFLGPCKIEILWRSGEPNAPVLARKPAPSDSDS